MSTTADKVLAYLRSRPELELQEEGKGQYRLNSPLRPGSNSHGFTLVINDDEHGAFRDYNPKGGPESGSLYELAAQLLPGWKPPRKAKPTPATNRPYTALADYAQAHGVAVEVLVAAGWSQTTYKDRPALAIKTQTGTKYRFLDGNEPRYLKAGPPCWYGLDRAVQLANGQPLVFCNGEASTVVAQAHGVAAATTTGGEGSKLNAKDKSRLLAELKAAYTGPILVALDCDDTGRDGAIKLTAELQQAGYDAKAVDLALGKGQDLADFCKLHQLQAAAELVKLKELSAPAAGPEKVPTITTAHYMAALKSLGLEFRLNLLDDSIEVNGKLLTDNLIGNINPRMRDIGYHKRLDIYEAILIAAGENCYHPVKAYLESLKWDGRQHINQLASYFKDTHGIFGLWLRKWLVGAVAKVYEPAQNPMLVLDGAQGKGKSHFAAWLCPLERHFVEGAIQPDNNDHHLRLAKTWIWEVSELGATTRKADREALKSFITQKEINARKPYGRFPIQKPAMASFIGTVNDEAGFLNDPTGSRRFLVCTLTDIRWGYSKQININDIWAEANHLYRTGYSWRLSPEEQQLQADINENYEVDEPLVSEVQTYYEITREPTDFVSYKDILTLMDLSHLEKRNTMRLAQAMKRLRLEKGKIGPRESRIVGYFGLKRKGHR